jgi:hypothetical protein
MPMTMMQALCHHWGAKLALWANYMAYLCFGMICGGGADALRLLRRLV